MSKIRETVAKAAGKVKRAGAALAGDKGIFRELKEEHAEVDVLMMQVQKGDVSTRRDLYPKIRAELLSHARAEQAVFYAVTRSYEETRELTTESLREHREIEELIERLDTTAIDTAAWRDSFEQLVRIVERHVDREENQLIPRAKEVLSADQAEEMERRFDEQKAREMERAERAYPIGVEGSTHGHAPPHV